MKIEAQCGSCQGTGVFRGQSEPKGFGVVCRECNGSGKTTIEYVPFTCRIIRQDVSRVGWSHGSSPTTRHDPEKDGILYQDFLAGQLPPRRSEPY